jgi:hypothetical protein
MGEQQLIRAYRTLSYYRYLDRGRGLITYQAVVKKLVRGKLIETHSSLTRLHYHFKDSLGKLINNFVY